MKIRASLNLSTLNLESIVQLHFNLSQKQTDLIFKDPAINAFKTVLFECASSLTFLQQKQNPRNSFTSLFQLSSPPGLQ